MGPRSKSIEQPTTPAPPTGRTRPQVARETKLARIGMEVHDAERERYVDDLKRAVWNNSYDPSADEIAAAMLDERENDSMGDI